MVATTTFIHSPYLLNASNTTSPVIVAFLALFSAVQENEIIPNVEMETELLKPKI